MYSYSNSGYIYIGGCLDVVLKQKLTDHNLLEF